MAQSQRWQQGWQYLYECVRLLYWTYFKPFTLRRWLRQIDEGLDLDTNPFSKQAKFAGNSRLARYASQLWWLTLITPIFTVIAVSAPYSIWVETFNYLRSIYFLGGWSIGLFMIHHVSHKVQALSTATLCLLTLFVMLDTGGSLYEHEFIGIEVFHLITFGPPVAFIVYGIIFGLAGTIPVAVIGAVTFGVALGVTGEAAFGVAFGIVFGVAFGIAFGIASGIGFGINAAIGRERSWIAQGSRIVLALGVVFGVPFAVGRLGGVAVSGLVWISIIVGGIRVYSWLPELLWMLILHVIVVEGTEARWLRFLPPRFDEVIILPLPFMADFIAQAHRSNPVAAQQTLDYFITSTNQQTVAAQAMVQIAINALSHCATLHDIAATADDLSWIPSPPPKQVGPLLPEFIEVSMAVRAAQAGTSVYRQWEALTPPRRRLEDLKKGLSQQEPRLATTYGGIIETWLGLIKTAQETLQAQAMRSGEIPGVYVAGAALDPDTSGNRFKGRQDLFREIEALATAAEPPTLLLYGGRRTGKTSALKYLPRRVGPDLVPLLVDVQGLGMATTLQGTAAFLAQQVQQAARQARNLTLPAPDTLALEVEPFSALQQWFSEVEKAARGKRFLLCLDEFERFSEVVNATGSRAPLNFLRYIIQHQRQWIVLFSGSHLPGELEDYWSDYLINTQSLRLSYLDEADARDLIQHPIDQFPDIYEPATVDKIVAVTHCQPYFVQLTCLVLVEFLNRQPQRRKATPQDVDTVIPKVIERGGEVLRERLRTLSSTEQDLLFCLATGQPIPSESQTTLVRLVQREILTPTDPHYRFQIPLFAEYVRGVQRGLYS